MTRKARLARAAAAALCAALAGCGTLFIDSIEQLRETNKSNIGRLYPGMPRFQAEEIMGRRTAGGKLGDIVYGRLRHLEVSNPLREERLRGSDGGEYEILFYYTDLRSRDDRITDDELTPVAFRDGRVAGVGYGWLGERLPKFRALK